MGDHPPGRKRPASRLPHPHPADRQRRRPGSARASLSCACCAPTETARLRPSQRLAAWRLACAPEPASDATLDLPTASLLSEDLET